MLLVCAKEKQQTLLDKKVSSYSAPFVCTGIHVWIVSHLANTPGAHKNAITGSWQVQSHDGPPIQI